jgi:hypothetical protein
VAPFEIDDHVVVECATSEHIIKRVDARGFRKKKVVKRHIKITINCVGSCHGLLG